MFKSDVRNPKTIFSYQAALKKVMSTCPQLNLDLRKRQPKSHIKPANLLAAELPLILM